MNFGEFRTNLLDSLSVSASDVFFSTDYLKRVVNRGIKWAAGLYDWPHTESAVIRDSEAGQEYVNIPENFKRDSITHAVYDGKHYEYVNWEDYQIYKENEGVNATDKNCSDYGNKLFFNPTPSSTIVGGIEIFGHAIPSDLTGDSDVTIFQGDTEIEEAILKWCEAQCLKKQRGSYFNAGVAQEELAKKDLSIIWDKIAKKQSKYKNKGRNMFNPVVITRRGSGYKTGSFRSC